MDSTTRVSRLARAWPAHPRMCYRPWHSRRLSQESRNSEAAGPSRAEAAKNVGANGLTHVNRTAWACPGNLGRVTGLSVALDPRVKPAGDAESGWNGYRARRDCQR